LGISFHSDVSDIEEDVANDEGAVWKDWTEDPLWDGGVAGGVAGAMTVAGSAGCGSRF